MLLVGDAAGLINPMTGEGIYYAVATGIAAGRAAAAGAPRRRRRAGPASCTAGRSAPLLGRHLKHTWAAARLVRERDHRRGRHPRGRSADGRIFDELVELGLGDGRISRPAGRAPGRRGRAPYRSTHARSAGS